MQHVQDIHKLPLHMEVMTENICVKANFIGLQEQSLWDGKTTKTIMTYSILQLPK